ncbi:ribosomal protein S16 [Coleophoma cylindrospora]|uniref:Ribosomal protein S16 n=1 Tax=Coleophoma cylindrospora TaxID=1849047 RepID=A0A3D8QKY6_9HELO|nr:ribosomal protein S16 [Coleophoma cylindrospora]
MADASSSRLADNPIQYSVDTCDLCIMVVKIRLARFGRRKAPFYNIVVAHARTARNSKPIEVLGTYDPIPKMPTDGEGKPFKDVKLDSARAKYWLGVGAQPSDPAWRLLSMAGLLEPKYQPNRPVVPKPSTV